MSHWMLGVIGINAYNSLALHAIALNSRVPHAIHIVLYVARTRFY